MKICPLTSCAIVAVFLSLTPGMALEYPPGFELTEIPDPLSGQNPEYPLPSMEEPSPGIEYLDAQFNTLLMKATVTDGIRSRHEYSRFDPFNLNGSLIVMDPEALWNVYSTVSIPYNQTGNLIMHLPLEEPRWDRSDPDLIWGVTGFQLQTVNVRTQQTIFVKDFAVDPVTGPMISSLPVYRITCKDEGESSFDRRFWAFLIQGDDRVDYEFLTLFCWDHQIDQVLGTYSLAENERNIDWAGMSWNGNWVLIGGMHDNGGNLTGLTMADKSFSTFHRIDYTTSHADIGLDASGNEVVVMQNVQTDFIDLIPVDPATQPILSPGDGYDGTNRTPLIRLFYDSESPDGLNSGVHISCNYHGYALISTTIEPNLPEQNWLDRSIVLVHLNSANVRAFYIAKLHNTTGSYWEETHGTISEDGSRIVWTDNWNNNVGQEQVFLTQMKMPPATPSSIRIDLKMPAHSFGAGDQCYLDLNFSNTGSQRTVDVYVLLEAAGLYFFYPGWSEMSAGIDRLEHLVQEGSESLHIIPEFTLPCVSPFGPMYFYSALFEPGQLSSSALIGNVSFWEFNLH